MAIPITAKIATACDRLSELELGGFKLEDADPALLNVSDFNLDSHVAAQPAAIAYYGNLKKEAARKLANLKRAYDRWSKKKWASAKASLGAGTGKTTVADIESRFIVDNEPELERWDKQLDDAQIECDTIDVWFEAWKQKSFSIREYAGIEEAERYNANSSITSEQRTHIQSSAPAESSIHRIRRMIKQRQDKGRTE